MGLAAKKGGRVKVEEYLNLRLKHNYNNPRRKQEKQNTCLGGLLKGKPLTSSNDLEKKNPPRAVNSVSLRHMYKCNVIIGIKGRIFIVSPQDGDLVSVKR